MEPLKHFYVHTIWPLEVFGLDISISNSVCWMFVAALLVLVFFRLSFRHQQIIPGRWQAAGELAYLFIVRMVEQNIGHDGRPFIPFLLTLFYFILACNLVGLIPAAFTPTAQIVVTATLAILVFALSLILRLWRHGLGFFHAFVPKGLPVYLLPLMIPVELLSFLARPVSLAVRLFANMTAGHTVLAVIAFFGLAMPWFMTWLPMSMSVVLMAAELFIAVIQAYIFTILACVYIDDALHE